MSTEPKPIIYDQIMDVRFADLDAYGHLNASVYLDLVASSRFIYLERVLGLSVADIVARGAGFYMTKATQEFIRPVKGLVQVRIQTNVLRYEGPLLVVSYVMSNPQTEKVYSKGELNFAIIDLATQRPLSLPDWMIPYFLES